MNELFKSKKTETPKMNEMNSFINMYFGDYMQVYMLFILEATAVVTYVNYQ